MFGLGEKRILLEEEDVTQMKHENLDEIDKDILNLLQKDARMTIKQIANEISLSSPAVSNRIEKMEREGYIKGYKAIVDLAALGYTTKAIVSVEVPVKMEQEFFSYILEQNNVVACNCVSGEYTMLLEVVFCTTADLDSFLVELQHYGKTITKIVFSTFIEYRGMNV